MGAALHDRNALSGQSGTPARADVGLVAVNEDRTGKFLQLKAVSSQRSACRIPKKDGRAGVRADYLSKTVLWWTISEAAQYLGISYRHCLELKTTGRLPCRKPGLPTPYIVDRVAVERLVMGRD